MPRFVLATGLMALAIGGFSSQAQAAIFGFVNNPNTNSSDFLTFVAGQGGVVNNNVNFETHPLGPLNSNFYLGSDGVTLNTTGVFGDVVNGAGPAQGNIFSTPLSSGEGLHAPSNFLFDFAGLSELTVSFSSPVQAAGLFMIDYFGPFGPSSTITAYAGANGTGAVLGSFSSVQANFQNDNLYFLGIASNAGNEIGSIVYSYNGSSTGDTTGIDNILFARVGTPPPPAVPEPSSLIISSVLLAAFGLSYSRKRTRRNEPVA